MAEAGRDVEQHLPQRDHQKEQRPFAERQVPIRQLGSQVQMVMDLEQPLALLADEATTPCVKWAPGEIITRANSR